MGQPFGKQKIFATPQCVTVDHIPPACSIIVSRGFGMCRKSSLAINYARSIGAVASGALGLRYGVSRFVEPALSASLCIVLSIYKA